MNESNFIDWMPTAINGKWGFIDITGKWVIKPTYTHAFLSYRQFYFVKKNNKWGIVDKEGKIIAQPQFEDIIN